MSKEITLKPEDRSVSIIEQYTTEQIQVIKQQVAVGATDTELVYFLQICKQQNLDPFSRQIYFVKRGTQMTIQTGIDGYRAMAEQTGRLGGIDEPVYEDANPYPKKATVTVYKFVQGNKVSFTASARWSEYFPGDKMGFMWKKMPYLMLGKVAEALALRKAFPKNLGGVYTEEEMAGASNTINQVSNNAEALMEEKPEEKSITKHQITKIKFLIKERGKELDKMLKYFKIEKLEDLGNAKAEEVIKMLESFPVAKTEVKKVEEKPVEIIGSPGSTTVEPQGAMPQKVEEVIEEMPATINSTSKKEDIIVEVERLSKDKKIFLSPLILKFGKSNINDLTKDQLLEIIEIINKPKHE